MKNHILGKGEHLSDVGGRPNKRKAEVRPLGLACVGGGQERAVTWGGAGLGNCWKVEKA